MKVRDDVLISSDDMGTSGTKIYDLDYSDVLSGITLTFDATNGASGNVSNPIERNVSKVEIVDGADVLWSLPGDVLYALYSQMHGNPGIDYYTGAISDSPFVDLYIRFGRYLYDPDLAFAPRNFKNPQLKVTFDEATVRAAGATGFVSDSFALTILSHLMEDAPAPSGWLMAKDLYDFTTVASGDEKIAMPTDYPWRQLMIRNYEAGVWHGTDISNYKLSCDGGKFIPFDLSSAVVTSRMANVYPPTYKNGYMYAANGDTIETWIGHDTGQSIMSHVAGIIATASSFNSARFTLGLMTHEGVATTNAVHFRAPGYCPHNTVFIPFGRLNEKAEWFNAPQYNAVHLYLTQGGAGAECNVCVEQVRTY